MKRLLLTFLCLNILGGQMMCFAQPENTVTITTYNTSLEAKRLKEKYSAYYILISNKGQNPVRIDNIKGDNLIDDMEKIQAACKMPTKLTTTLSLLGMVTFGLTTIISIPIMQNDYKKMQEASTEVCKYKNAALLNAKNETLMPEQTIKFAVLAPLNEPPRIIGVFEDLKTHEFIQAHN